MCCQPRTQRSLLAAATTRKKCCTAAAPCRCGMTAVVGHKTRSLHGGGVLRCRATSTKLPRHSST